MKWKSGLPKSMLCEAAPHSPTSLFGGKIVFRRQRNERVPESDWTKCGFWGLPQGWLVVRMCFFKLLLVSRCFKDTSWEAVPRDTRAQSQQAQRILWNVWHGCSKTWVDHQIHSSICGCVYPTGQVSSHSDPNMMLAASWSILKHYVSDRVLTVCFLESDLIWSNAIKLCETVWNPSQASLILSCLIMENLIIICSSETDLMLPYLTFLFYPIPRSIH